MKTTATPEEIQDYPCEGIVDGIVVDWDGGGAARAAATATSGSPGS